VPYHVEKSCKDYLAGIEKARIEAKLKDINSRELKEDRLLKNWAKQVGAKQCKKCKFWVQKNDGCNHMTCRCGYEFCYVCGGKY